MAIIDSAYQYYLSTYRNSTVSRYDTHKKSQLRDTYNRIVKINKESPLYKIKDVGNVAKYAIDIKENTKSLQNVIASLDGGIEGIFAKHIAQSSDEDVVTAEYIGNDESDASNAKGFDIQVQQLASNQINQGNFLNPESLDVEPGSYSFDLNTNTRSYEFQYSVNDKDTNLSVLRKLSKLVNSAGIGLSSTVEKNEDGFVALRISSKQTGISENEDYLFQILPSAGAPSAKAMHVLGINQIETEAKSSSFLLNGIEHSSYSNTFTVDNHFDITLRGIHSKGNFAKIDFKANADAIADNVQRLISAYNNIIDLAHSHTESRNSNKLIRDMSSVARNYHNELEAIGINTEDDSTLTIDRNLLTDAITAPDAKETFSILNDFKDDLNERSTMAFIDPMNYVNKLVVAYKNPGRNFATPYITSIYSGMMLDQYC
ncbi:MAG: flagellar capping protein [Roseburia sp.]|nr:flagellar capping protein [Roseburia sp.]